MNNNNCNCNIKKTQQYQNEKNDMNKLITAQINPYRQASKMNDNINGFELILNQPYNQVWSAGNFFRDKNYQKASLFYELPYKDMAIKK
jgi:hypothetical protein